MTTFTFEQADRTYTVTPLESGESVEEFYGSSGNPTTTNIENTDGSVLFFHRNPDRSLSLVVIHDYPGDGSGGAVSFEITPSGSANDAEWLLMDDNHDFSGSSDMSPDWTWNDYNKDGGVLDGSFTEEFDLTIEPAFNGDAARNPLSSGTINDWEVLSGGESNNVEDPIRKPLAKDLKLMVSTSGQDVTASMTTLQFIPGESESPSEGGHPLDSSLMQMLPDDLSFSVWGHSVEFPTRPVLDNWLGGDMTDTLPISLDEARNKKVGKYFDDVGPEAEFKKYRFENGVSVSFETISERRIDKSTVEIEFSEVGPSGSDSRIFRGDQENSKTVLHDHEINDIPWEDWYDGENVRRSNRHNRYFDYNRNFEFEGVQGVRVHTFWGGYAGFVADISRRASDEIAEFLNEIWEWDVDSRLAELAIISAPELIQFFADTITTVPNTYSYIDFIVLADGRRYARVWDASQYPSMFTYVDGSLQVEERMPYEPRQLGNKSMIAFMLLAMAGATPYHSDGDRRWERLVRGDTRQRTVLEKELERRLNKLPFEWDALDLLPQIPRMTVGYNTKTGEPIENPDEPFPSAENLAIPWFEALPSN